MVNDYKNGKEAFTCTIFLDEKLILLKSGNLQINSNEFSKWFTDTQVISFFDMFECSKGEKLMSEVENAIFLIEGENDYPMYWDSAIQNFHYLLQGKYSENQATLDDYYQDFDQDKSVSGSERLDYLMV